MTVMVLGFLFVSTIVGARYTLLRLSRRGDDQ